MPQLRFKDEKSWILDYRYFRLRLEMRAERQGKASQTAPYIKFSSTTGFNQAQNLGGINKVHSLK
jgi:hypothetical protein